MLRGFFMSDSGAAGSAGSSTSAETKKPESDEQQDEQQQQDEHMIPKSRFDTVNKELAELRTWRQQREQQDERAKKQQQKAADDAAAQRGEYERLATERQSRIAQLESERETVDERLQALTDAMEKQIKLRMKALPDELQALIADSADVLARYEQLGKVEAAATKLTPVAQQPRTSGTPSGPRASGAPATANNVDLVAKKKAEGDYAF